MQNPAFLFSGQGSQAPGMGRDLCGNFPQAAAVYELASEILGYDVLKLSSQGSEQQLAQPAVSQPLIYILSMAAFAVLRENGVIPGAVAGHSLGEVGALTVAGAFELETGLRVIACRAKAMQKAAEESGGAMYAVIGPSAGQIEDACARAGGYVVPVNYNCPGQIVIAGENGAALRASKLLQEGGARVVKLAVNAAFHSETMRGAAEESYEGLSSLPLLPPKGVFYSNLTGGRAEIDDTALYLKTQMASPVLFKDEMDAMARDGFETFIELGPGRTLCGLVRRGIKSARAYNVEDKKSLLKCLEAVGRTAG